MQGEKQDGTPLGGHDSPGAWAPLVALAAIYVVLSVIGGHLPLPHSAVSTVASIVVGLLLLAGGMYYVVKVPASPLTALATGTGLLFVWGWLALLMKAGQTRPSIAAAVADVCLAGAAGSLGKFAVRFVSAGNLLLPIAVTAAIFDVVYVYGGPMQTQRVIGGEALAVVTAAVPALGGRSIPGASGKAVLGGIGFGDLAMLAFFFAAAAKFRMDASRAFWYILPLTVLAFMIAVWYVDAPGWVPIGLGFVLANHRFFRFTAEEKRAMLYAGPVVLLVAGALIGAARLAAR